MASHFRLLFEFLRNPLRRTNLRNRAAGSDVQRTFSADGDDRSDKKSAESKKMQPAEPAAQPPPRDQSLLHFDDPVRPALVTRKEVSGPIVALFDDAHGRAWSINVLPGALNASASVAATPIEFGDDVVVSDWCDLWDNKIVLWRSDGPRERLDVRDIRDGAVLYSTLSASTATLAPDGRRLLLLEDDGISVADLGAPEIQIRQSGLFPIANRQSGKNHGRPDYQLDNPSSVMAVAADNNDTFTLAIGDYGFAIAATMRIGRPGEAPLVITQTARAYATGLVYDPVDIIDVVPSNTLLVRHGYGSGITRFDLRTGAASHCPLPDGQTNRDYGTFRLAIASIRSPLVWIQTNIGPCVWDGADSLKQAPEGARVVLATDGDQFLGLSPDGRDIVCGRF